MDQHSLENPSFEMRSAEGSRSANPYGATGGAPAIAGYSVCRRLGRGGSAEVWLVAQDSTGVKLALKCFGRPRGSGEPGGAEPGSAEPGSADTHLAVAREEDIRRELLVMSVLDHEHLVKAYGVVRTDEPGSTVEAGRTEEAGGGRVGLLMDYAAGGSLQQLVTARGALSVGETVTVLTPIAQVLGYLHGKGFTHSDVAPGNVLFTAHGKPLLADLGVARMVGDVSGIPDQHTDGFADPAPVDAVRAGLQPERDVYAAAALGWYCLTGQPPPPSAARPPLSLLVPDVPAELAAVLEAGLSDDRRQRPAAAEFGTAVYRSAAAVPVDLSRSVHDTVLPELLTRRPVPPSGGRVRKRLLAWGRRLKSAGWVRPLGRPSSHGAPSNLVPSVPQPDARHAAARRAASHASRHTPASHAAVRHAADRQPGRSRRLALVGGVLTAAVIAGAGLVGLPGAAQEAGPAAQEPALPASPAPSQGPDLPGDLRRRLAAKDPVEAVLGLAQLRSLALREGRLDLLDDVNAPNTPAQAADRRIRARLEKSGTVLAGFTTSLSAVRRLPGNTPGRAVVAVTSSTSAYEERSAGGAVVAAGARQQDIRLRLVLVQAAGRWRIADILPAG
ncbi:protein kinase domain-containing protein [Arthrobacter globiformis]|uniref:protein kinase domain-containing protein n=1 Tax=Arthrobacter globiformis TaxID=1665 RepID=UPI002783980E|nr:protein kinase [Arthrobacter globiformis]MDQ0864373.1 serine/threonine protein kinase [Arthrobacter globiformis]